MALPRQSFARRLDRTKQRHGGSHQEQSGDESRLQPIAVRVKPESCSSYVGGGRWQSDPASRVTPLTAETRADGPIVDSTKQSSHAKLLLGLAESLPGNGQVIDPANAIRPGHKSREREALKRPSEARTKGRGHGTAERQGNGGGVPWVG